MASSWNKGTLSKTTDVMSSAITGDLGFGAVQSAVKSASRAVQDSNSLYSITETASSALSNAIKMAEDRMAQGAQVVSDAASDVAPTISQGVEAVSDTLGGMDLGVSDPLGAVQDSLLGLGQKAKQLWEIGTSTPAKLLAKDIVLVDFVKDRSVINEADFQEDELEFIKKLARKKGVGRVTKADYGQLVDTGVRGTSEDAITKGTAEVADRVYNSLSYFNITKDPETGEYFAEDQYDWNVYVDYTDPKGGFDPKTKRPRGVVYDTEEFEKKGFNLMEELFKTLGSDASEFDKAHNLAFLLGSRDYKDNKLDTGRKVKINLGKLD